MAKDENRATCEKHGSLGNYGDSQDARNAETMHQNTAHRDGTSVAAQHKINKHGERK